MTARFLFYAVGIVILTSICSGNIDVKFVKIIDGKKLDGFQSTHHSDVNEIQCMGICSINSKECHSVNYHEESRRCIIKTDVTEEKVHLQLKNEKGWKYLEKSKAVVSLLCQSPVSITSLQFHFGRKAQNFNFLYCIFFISQIIHSLNPVGKIA